MGPLHIETVITAPRYVVWDALADIRTVVEWNPGIDDVECLSDQVSGIGARRRCFTHPTGWMTESVVEWSVGSVVAFSVEDAPPLKNGLARIVLNDITSGTSVDAVFDYEVKLGPLGPVIDRLIVHRQLTAAFERGLNGLRDYTETQWTNADTPQSWHSGQNGKRNTL
ncbi:MAG: SRPBCC family protein [Actinomycetia bacterium]|nr:SRPBCC family protein [Actinomycetes bacterium]